MSRHAARLAKLEASMPPPRAILEEDGPGLEFRFAEWLERFEAEKVRFDALSPAGKILSILAKIAETTAEAALPVPAPRTDGIVDLGPQMHACLVHEVKQGFRSEYFEIRRYELEILASAGFYAHTLKTAHAQWEHLPWQWRREDHPLPAEALFLINRALSVAEGTTLGPGDQTASAKEAA